MDPREQAAAREPLGVPPSRGAPWVPRGDLRLTFGSKEALRGFSAARSDVTGLASPGLSGRALARVRSPGGGPGSPKGVARLLGPGWWGEPNPG